MNIRQLLLNLPEVEGPTQKYLSFKEKLKWTGIMLVLFYILSLVPLFGLGQNALQRFEILSIILGASFGSILSLGIGPLVTASIVLQLLNGSGILKFDLTKKEDRQTFQGLQKIFGIFFVVFEAAVYVLMGGLAPPASLAGTSAYRLLELALIAQLAIGGLLVMFMDEVVSKWGFGSGISLFIAAGVSQSVFIRALSPMPSPNNPATSTGALPAFFQSLQAGDPTGAILLLSQIAATIIVFIMAVYMQSMKVELPLSFGRVRGQGIRWPLSFNYTSNIPVILVSALIANVNLWAQLLQQKGYPILGTLANGVPISGIVSWLSPINIAQRILTGGVLWSDIAKTAVYLIALIIGCVVFSYLWVQTAGMDAKSQAKQIMNSGLQIPGFRRDERVLERILDRYIAPLTIMGAIAVGILAGLADISGALTNGTGLLLTVMIIYKLYEDIARQHMMDMNPLLRRFITT
ncbi:preprotein translocase subunit SecY [Candidatus Woesearchaeota archaeon]|nr:preprotein translocase subunit SecY [Candidatus Woesearchaeota archaeon]